MSDDWQVTLRKAIVQNFKSVRGYARHRAGPEATTKAIESQRRQINKWLEKEKPTIPERDSITDLVRDLGVDPKIFPRRPPIARYTNADLAELHKETLENQRLALVHLKSIAASVETLGHAVRSLEVAMRGLSTRRGAPGSSEPGRRGAA